MSRANIVTAFKSIGSQVHSIPVPTCLQKPVLIYLLLPNAFKYYEGALNLYFYSLTDDEQSFISHLLSLSLVSMGHRTSNSCSSIPIILQFYEKCLQLSPISAIMPLVFNTHHSKSPLFTIVLSHRCYAKTLLRWYTIRLCIWDN